MAPMHDKSSVLSAIQGAALYVMAPWALSNQLFHDFVLSAIQGAALYVMAPCSIPGSETASVTCVFWTSWKGSEAVSFITAHAVPAG